MKSILLIHLSTGEQEMDSGANLMIIPRLGENVKNHDGAFEKVVDVTYAYLTEGIVVHVYTKL